MAKDIQIKYINNLEEWEELYPLSKTKIVTNDSGQTVDELLKLKANKNETYTSVEIDQKITTIEESIDGISEFDIPVSDTEPVDDSKIWFEVK